MKKKTMREILNNIQEIQKDGTKKHRMTTFMVILNMVIAVAFLTSFFLMSKLMRNEEYKDAKLTQSNIVSTMANQIGSHIQTQDMIISSYGSYITEDGLTFDETVDYLEHWKSFYEEIALVELEGDGVYKLLPESDSLFPCSLADAQYLQNIKDTYNDSNSHVSSLFKTEDGENAFGIFCKVSIEGKEYLIVFASTFKNMEIAAINVEGMEANTGVLLDREYKLLEGTLVPGEDAAGKDYFADVARYIGQDEVAEAIHSLEETGEAYLELYEERLDKTFATFIHKVPGNEGWIYVYHVDTSGFNKASDSILMMIIFTISFMGCWVILELVIFSIYSRSLRRYISVVDEQNEELKRANAAKSVFVSNMSHEVRTPINAVLGLDEMILRECQDETILGYATDIQRSGKTLLGIINDVLDFSKIESGKLEINPAEYSIEEVVKDVYRMIALRAQSKYLTFEVQIAEDIPSLLYGDDIRLKQCIVNLLTNAVKYTEKGTVRFTIQCACEGDEAKIRVEVQDTGIGMKEEEMDKLLVPYERLDTKRNRSIEGTGLGLPLVVRLLDMMGSKLEVHSVYGEGSTFAFTISQKIVDASPLGKVDFEQRGKVQIYQSTLYAPEAKILAVDDVAINLKVVTGLLKQTGISVDTASDGQHCLQMTKVKKYDLILLDHRMPGMDGIETLHALQKQEGLNGDTPVIALTANVVAGAKESYQKEGFTDFLGKPIDAEHLEKAIGMYLPEKKVLDKSAAEGAEAISENHRILKKEQVLAPENIRIAQEKIAAMKEREEAAMKEAAEQEAARKAEAEKEKAKKVRVASVIKQPAPVKMSIRDAIKGAAGFEEEAAHEEVETSAAVYEEYPEDGDYLRELPPEIYIDDAVNYCGSLEFAYEVIDEFRNDAPAMLASLQGFLAAADIENFTIQAHSIKSTAKMIGAREISEQARILEVMGKAGNIYSARDKVEKLEKMLKDLLGKL